MAVDKKKQSIIAISKELRKVEKQELSLQRARTKSGAQKWKQALEDKVPEKVFENLQKAFCKAFLLIFEKGTGIIEKSYNRNAIQEDHEIQNFAFEVKANRKSLKNVRKTVGASRMVNMAYTTAEGIGLGVFGIGLPDIVIFVGVLLKGIYEVALRYGFDYDTAEERYFILKLMETAMLRGEDWRAANNCVESMILSFLEEDFVGDDKELDMERQIQQTANTFAIDMILLKFVQGLPLVGVIGGAGNPVYYNKVMKYVEIKYRKRYLLTLRKKAREIGNE